MSEERPQHPQEPAEGAEGAEESPASSGPETMDGCRRTTRRGPWSTRRSQPREPKRPRRLLVPSEPNARASC
jgi:hypothetical protein